MSKRQACPICNIIDYSPVCKDDHFFLCNNCGTIINFNYSELNYNKNYFLDDYKAQYNKTYAEDRSSLLQVSHKRLDKILKIWSKVVKKNSPRSLLDLGAALGFFLDAARSHDFEVLEGVEISEYAASYSEKELNIPLKNVSFEKATFDTSFDVVTAWYFLEHCKDPLKALQRVYNLLSDQGVVAFSFPSYFGPQYIFKRKEWLEMHPTDHRVDFSPKSIKRVLKSLGFRKVKVYASGFHPERVISRKNFLYYPFSFLYKVFTKLTAFSDTIEVYAVK